MANLVRYHRLRNPTFQTYMVNGVPEVDDYIGICDVVAPADDHRISCLRIRCMFA